MKKKVLLSSLLTIALCLCLIAGSTFALFTSSDEFNIAVTAGKVNVEAWATISAVYSAEGVAEGEKAEDEFLIDENKYEYKHVKQADNETFANGGKALLNGTSLKIERLTPGDKVDVAINVKNNSNVAINYRYKISIASDKGLATGMVLSVLEDSDAETKDALTFANTAYEGFESYTSEWYYAEAPEGKAEEILPRTISVELPVYADNEYQEKSVEYTILVEAVQGNAVTTNDSVANILPAAIAKKFEKGGNIDGKGAIVVPATCIESKNDLSFTNITIEDGDELANGWEKAIVFATGYESHDIVIGENATVNVTKDNFKGIRVLMGWRDMTLKEGSKINVSGNGSYGIHIMETGAKETNITLEATDLIEVTGERSYGIAADGTATVLNIHVPTKEVMDHYLNTPNLIYATGGATIRWYVGDEVAAETTYTAPVIANSTGTGYTGEAINEPNMTDMLVFQNAALNSNAAVTVKRTYSTVVFEDVVANVAGDLITLDTANTVVFWNCDITLEEGKLLVSAAENLVASDTQVMIHNVTVDGVLITDENLDDMVAKYFATNIENIDLF